MHVPIDRVENFRAIHRDDGNAAGSLLDDEILVAMQ
jgi:hypothetical protein